MGTAVATFLTLSGTTNAVGLSKAIGRSPLINFAAVPVAGGGGAIPRISADYQYDVLIPWGDPIQPGGPVFNYPPSSADQALQIGIGHDGMWFFPFPAKNSNPASQVNEHGLLVVNHEYGDNGHVFDRNAPAGLEDVRISQHAHGVSVVEIRKIGGKWQTVNSEYARRIHGDTEVTFSGPVAGHALLQTPAGNTPKDTLDNCGNGYTPWGTYLTCEENFNGYFGATGPWTANPNQQRYGFSAGGFGYGWDDYDARFDLSNPN